MRKVRSDELELPFIWIDEGKQLLSVGSIIENTDTGSNFSKIEQTYYLEIICDEDSMTRIINKILLKGLSSGGKWMEVTDIPAIEAYGSKFLQVFFISKTVAHPLSLPIPISPPNPLLLNVYSASASNL